MVLKIQEPGGANAVMVTRPLGDYGGCPREDWKVLEILVRDEAADLTQAVALKNVRISN